MRTLDEIANDIQLVRASQDTKALRRFANELFELRTPNAHAYAEMTLGNAFLIDGFSAEALQHLDRAIGEYQQLNDKACEAGALANSGLAFLNVGDFPNALKRFIRARSLFEEMGNQAFVASITGNIGGVYYRTGSYPEALEHFNQALQLHSNTDNKGGVGTALGNIGMVYHSMKEFDTAQEFYRKSMDIDIAMHNRNGEAMSLGNIGMIQRMRGEHNDAIECLNKAIDISESVGAEAHVALLLGELASLHIELLNIELAETVMDKQAGLNLDNPAVRAQRHENHAAIEELNDSFDNAASHLNDALAIADTSGLRAQLSVYHLKLRDLAKKQNNFEAYIAHNEEHHRINNEIQGQETTRRLAMIEAQKVLEAERAEKEKHRELLYSTLPKSVADRMIRGEQVTSDHFEHACVLFTDIVGFTSHSSSMRPGDVVTMLATMFAVFDTLCEEHSVMKVKTIGDSYMCFKGDADATTNASSIAALALALKGACGTWSDGSPIQIRVGMHIGTATAGVIGTQRLQYDVWGDTVNVASRLESTSLPDRIHVSHEFVDACNKATTTSNNIMPMPPIITFATRGTTDIKGKGTMETYWLSCPAKDC